MTSLRPGLVVEETVKRKRVREKRKIGGREEEKRDMVMRRRRQ